MKEFAELAGMETIPKEQVETVAIRLDILLAVMDFVKLSKENYMALINSAT